MAGFDHSQPSRSDAKPQTNKAKPETTSWRKRLLEATITAGLLVTAGGNGIPDLSRPENASSNLHLPENHNLTKYTSPPPIPEYLNKLDNPVSPKDAPSPRKRELDKKASQSLNTTSGVERILQNEEFKKKIILVCKDPELAKVCVALAKNQEVMDNFKQDEHFRNSLLVELGKDPELADACVTLAKNQKVMDNFKQDEYCMKILSELGQDPEFALTCVALAKNNKLLDNSYPPLNVTDVKGNLNVIQEKAHGRNLDTMQKNIKGQQRPGRKLLSIQEPERESSTEKRPFTEKVADMLLQAQMPQRLTFNEMITEKQLSLTEKQLDHTNWRDNVYMTVTGGILILAGITLFYNNRQLQKQCETLRTDKENLRNENSTVTRERDDLSRKINGLVEPKDVDLLRKDIDTLKTHNAVLTQRNDVLALQVGNLEKQRQELLQAGEKGLSEISRLKLEKDFLEKDKQTSQENHQKELQKLREENQALIAKQKNLEQEYQKLWQSVNNMAPHERQRITQSTVSSSSSVPSPWGNFS